MKNADVKVLRMCFFNYWNICFISLQRQKAEGTSNVEVPQRLRLRHNTSYSTPKQWPWVTLSQRKWPIKHHLYGVIGWDRRMQLPPGTVSASSHSQVTKVLKIKLIWDLDKCLGLGIMILLKTCYLILEPTNIICFQFLWMYYRFAWFKNFSPFGNEGQNRITLCWTPPHSVGDLQVIVQAQPHVFLTFALSWAIWTPARYKSIHVNK